MRWLVTGAAGQLGHHVASVLARAGADAVCLTRAELDVSDPAAVDAAINIHDPDVVINAAAYTAVDAAETDEARALAVNAGGPKNLATALATNGGKLIHVSTDYVFDGASDRPYGPADAPAPRTAYGRTKLAGEAAALAALPDRCSIVRTAWVYGGPGPNFVETMLRLEGEQEFVQVVTDQVGSPTWVADLASALVELGGATVDLHLDVLHYANTGVASWYDLAREAFRLSGADPARVRPATSDQFLRAAARPAWSVLSTQAWTAAGLPAPRDWQTALADFVVSRDG